MPEDAARRELAAECAPVGGRRIRCEVKIVVLSEAPDIGTSELGSVESFGGALGSLDLVGGI